MSRTSSLFTMAIELAPVLVALAMVAFVPLAVRAPTLWALATLAVYAVGFAMFASAKLPMLGQARWWSFGPADLPEGLRKRYWTGYSFMAAGLLMTIALVVTDQVGPL